MAPQVMTASQETPGATCPYAAPVIAIDECPRISETTSSGTPWLSITLAAECRSVCSPASGRPAVGTP